MEGFSRPIDAIQTDSYEIASGETEDNRKFIRLTLGLDNVAVAELSFLLDSAHIFIEQIQRVVERAKMRD